MCRKIVFGCFIQVGLYISRIAFGRFARKALERAAFMVTMSALVLRSRGMVQANVGQKVTFLILP